MGKLLQNTDIKAELIENEVILRRLKEVGCIFLICLAVYITLSLATYDITDPAWSTASSLDNTIKNHAGSFGAMLADVFLYFVGYMSFLVPCSLFSIGSSLILNRKVKQQSVKIKFIVNSMRMTGFLLILISGCALFSSYFVVHESWLPATSGGVLGQVSSLYFIKTIGLIGSTIIFISSILAGLTLMTGFSWVLLVQSFGRAILNIAQISSKIIIKLFSVIYTKISKIITGIKLKDKFNNKFAKPIMQVKKTKIVELSKPNFKESQKPVIKKSTSQSLEQKAKSDALIKEREDKDFKNFVSKVEFSGNLPDLDLLEKPRPEDYPEQYSTEFLEFLSNEVEARLKDFGVDVKVVSVLPGPVITRFELNLAPGLKVSKITGLSKDLARSLSVTSVRVVEVIPGKSFVGLEIPNKERELVRLRELLESKSYREPNSPLTMALGKDISGIPVASDLARMPHLLVAGTTGSGKSVGVNAMLLSILFKATPDDVRLILIDPKMLELSVYDGIPHLLTPVVTDMKDAAHSLKWCVAEMERRYQLLSAVGVRNLKSFNNKITEAIANNNPIKDPLWEPGPGEDESAHPTLEKLPYIVVIIDEFADMIMVVGKKVEELIARIAQKARAAGIHMILATQRPSVDVITGLIKANVPSRIGFQVSSKIDSRTILDQQGADQLLGHGDMLFLPPGSGIPQRLHGAFVSDEEVHRVVKSIKKGSRPNYIDEISDSSMPMSFSALDGVDDDAEQDELYDEAVSIVCDTRKASISYLQRRLKIGYNRSARLIEAMENAGLVSEVQGSGGREVLIPAREG